MTSSLEPAWDSLNSAPYWHPAEEEERDPLLQTSFRPENVLGRVNDVVIRDRAFSQLPTMYQATGVFAPWLERPSYVNYIHLLLVQLSVRAVFCALVFKPYFASPASASLFIKTVALNRRYSYSRGWTGTNMQSRLMRGKSFQIQTISPA